ncbi:MAG: UDP-4-amino-4-deoxy-L-arabinose--oxoglutarate aminotransferase [Candidatus Methanofastidiosum methylothiophilum]|jgi:UDP-4-amino-4,6-dideoxy-N-acetyl-beta-L-altrosamine transaminase|uniref:UDP-4-amino-4-deoxy-L-arabinose--oxoglutarate aminotransferase n=1 Tax=Candidatus Methanofastidiosum methylothiophilum TaxID=1705564 RepID=A0A150JHN7_9EURY|nr:MAG: UDP-4-amino-4-deoxy-L-arabinose--oxoglutarate aminotransferase [Candidatus Methanofastidiosum methylthiophilus]KYC55935.1 MAG: UDP-4-amino-4-deoxy-L-arabinose--oxoglutarate aminotransferase [Candidatus Methanofastidiosum methylthiophilus]KYC56696.1 MAG: UDP-4-amino-4-deoxy-L-arabinose--oxoglutarate aminotransferase [Candidatus Methanofastidiosum methylthiophilus]
MNFIPYGLHSIDQEDINEVIKVLKTDWLTTGPKIKEFEDALCNYVGCENAVVVNSGASALDIAVQSLDLPKKSEIITSPFTFVATSNSILYNNHKPVFVDIEKETRNIDPKEIEKKITKKTGAIIYIDYAGHPCEIDEIKEIADNYDLLLIEDASHSIGAEYKGKKIGNFADMTIFSFHPVKNITTGEGGAVLTNNPKYYEKLKMLRNHGINKETKERYGKEAGYEYDMKLLGRNYRITDLQCALGLSQLKKLNLFVREKKRLSETYNKYLSELEFIDIPTNKAYVKHAWHLYTILINDMDRDDIFIKLRKMNIGVNVHYIPIYHFTYYKENFNFKPKNYPVTEEVFHKIISLPLFPTMSSEQQNYVIDNLSKLSK